MQSGRGNKFYLDKLIMLIESPHMRKIFEKSSNQLEKEKLSVYVEESKDNPNLSCINIYDDKKYSDSKAPYPLALLKKEIEEKLLFGPLPLFHSGYLICPLNIFCRFIDLYLNPLQTQRPNNVAILNNVGLLSTPTKSVPGVTTSMSLSSTKR